MWFLTNFLMLVRDWHEGNLISGRYVVCISALVAVLRKADNLTTILCRCHEIWEP